MNKLTQSKSITTKISLLAALLLAVIGSAMAMRQLHAETVPPNITVIAPTSSNVQRGKINLSFRVNNLQLDQYEPFWAVGNGQWNRLSNGGNVSSGVIDISSWHWQADDTYELTLIALKKSDWKPITTKITIHISSATAPVAEIGTSQPILGTSPAPIASAVPSAQMQLYVDPSSDVATKARAWASNHPDNAAAMNNLATKPLASWFGNWNNNVTDDVNSYVSRATSAKSLPVLVAYNIPGRDCGSYSAGGSASKDHYEQWIGEFAAGIGKRDAIVLVEPDALAAMDCLSRTDQAQRVTMLHDAINILKSKTNATVYLDAGNTRWHSASDMASRLTQAGVSDADGFSLNVSNFITTSDNISFGTTLSKLVGDKHFVIDTSRNGSGPAPDFAWCNPAGRSIGDIPTLRTDKALVDAYLWVKAPGGSDGTCGPKELDTTAPRAGEWWPEYAVTMLR